MDSFRTNYKHTKRKKRILVYDVANFICGRNLKFFRLSDMNNMKHEA